IGAAIPIQITFATPVTVTGTPLLALATGASPALAMYSSGSGTDTLTFTYTAGAGDASADLNYVSTLSLTLNGGSISDTFGNAATLTLPATDASGSLASNKNIVIDGAAPT